LSDQAGIRRYVDAEGSGLNPEGWNTFDLLDTIASYQGAEHPTAPITGGIEQFADSVAPGAFRIELGAGRQTPTSVKRLLDATQALANCVHYVQPAIPGALRGVESQPWMRRRETRGPSLGETMEAERRSSVPTADLDARAGSLESYLEDSVRNPVAGPLQDFKQQYLEQRLQSLRAQLGRRDDAAKAAEWAAGSGQYEPSTADPSQLVIPGLDPDSIPRPLPNPTPADYDAAMRRKAWTERVNANPDLALVRTPPIRSVTPLSEVLARPEAMAPEAQFDPEELGLDNRQPMWSDFADTGEGGNAGYGVLQVPGSTGTGRGAYSLGSYGSRVAPFLQLAKDRGAVSPGHARSIVEAAFRNPASPPSSLSAQERVAAGRLEPAAGTYLGATPLDQLVSALGSGGGRPVFPASTGGRLAAGAASPLDAPATAQLAIANAIAQLLDPSTVKSRLPAGQRPWSQRRYGSAPVPYRNPRPWGGGFDYAPPELPDYGPGTPY
jgi:hypothetical protein